MDKIKVYNPTKHDVGVFLIEAPLAPRNIRPGAFLYITDADIETLAATTTLFSEGHLRVEDEKSEIMAEHGIDVNENPHFIDDAEIKKKFSMSAKKIGEWLDTITAKHVLERVYEVAMTMDLPKTKLEVLSAKMPDREFI